MIRIQNCFSPKTSVFIKVRSRTASIFLKGYLCSIIEKNKK
ncbi:hypothetical protein SAMN02746065_113130, partial [Desulfocicer vacuolatum DSM 3385]